MDKLLTRKPTRLKNYNYSNNGCYFVTVCSKNRENIFGKINNTCVGADGCRPDNNMKLNEFVLIINEELKNTQNIRNEIEIDSYIIMPNHIHFIININNFVGAGSPCPNKNNNTKINGRGNHAPTIGNIIAY